MYPLVFTHSWHEQDIDGALHRFIISNGAYPSPLGYRDFPKSCCTSVNNVVVHGVPDRLVLFPLLQHRRYF